MQVMDTFCDDGQKASPNLITHAHVEPVDEIAAGALMPAIESAKEGKRFLYLRYTKKEMRIAK